MTIIPKMNSEHLCLDIELIQKRFNIFNCYHIAFILWAQRYNYFQHKHIKFNDKVEFYVFVWNAETLT